MAQSTLGPPLQGHPSSHLKGRSTTLGHVVPTGVTAAHLTRTREAVTVTVAVYRYVPVAVAVTLSRETSKETIQIYELN